MKIAYVVRQYHKGGGICRYVAELAEVLSEQHEVHVVTSPLYRLEDQRVKFHIVPMTSFETLRRLKKHAWNNVFEVTTFMKNSSKVVGSEKFDIIHSQGDYNGDCDVYTAHSCHKAWLAMTQAENGNIVDRIRKSAVNPLHYAVLKAERCSIYRSKKIISVSESIKEEILRQYDVGADKIITIPNGVDTEKFSPVSRQAARESIRGKYSIDKDAVVMIFPAHEFKRKGFGQVIEAMHALRLPELYLLAVGRDDGAPYRAILSEYGLSDRVIFAGWSERIEDYFAASDLMPFPTAYEPFGLVVIEAMASGLPVIVTRSAGVAELMTDGEDGLFLSDRSDIQELANRVRALAKNREQRDAIGAKARATAEKYSWRKIAEMNLSLYNKILEEKKS